MLGPIRTERAASVEGKAVVEALVFVNGIHRLSGPLEKLSHYEGRLHVEDTTGFPNQFVLFVPSTGEIYRECELKVRWPHCADWAPSSNKHGFARSGG